jgi:hypothetical protein
MDAGNLINENLQKLESFLINNYYIFPLENGSTRKPRDYNNEKHYRIKMDSTQNGINGFLRKLLFQNKTRDIIKYSL